MSESKAVYDFETGEEVPGAGLPVPADSSLPEAQDAFGEYISKESKIRILENETWEYLCHEAASKYEAGRRLAEIRTIADGKRWSESLEKLCIQEKAADQRIKVYLAVQKFPSLMDMARKQWSKALALIEGLEDKDLELIGVDQFQLLTLDKVDKMSVREMRKAIRLLTAEREKVLAEETKNDKAEIKGLIGERDALRAQLESDADAAHQTAREVRATVQILVDKTRVLIGQIERLDLKDARQVEDTIQTAMANGKLLLDNVWADWLDRAEELGLGD